MRPKFKSHSKKNRYLRVGYKGLVFCRNNSQIMENMDNELTVPKCVLIVQPKIPQMPQKISAQNVCPSPKVQDFWKKLSLGVCSPRYTLYSKYFYTLTFDLIDHVIQFNTWHRSKMTRIILNQIRCQSTQILAWFSWCTFSILIKRICTRKIRKTLVSQKRFKYENIFRDIIVKKHHSPWIFH